MPRTHKRKLGARRYQDYNHEKIEQALTAVVEGQMSIRGASREFGIPYGTLNNKFHGKHGSNPGGKPIFNPVEERAFVKGILKCSDWGFPLNQRDLKMLVKNYLNSRGIQERRFTDNIPGDDWIKLFLKRHRNELGQRWAANIKRARAEVNRQTIVEYFDNLRETLLDIEPSNIFNYDETSVADDPGKIKALFRRGTKYPERVINHSKSATTVMMCGSASGVLLPPYIIYKGEHLWNTWKIGGPKGLPCCPGPCCSAGSRYARTKHGWIDAETFSDWFETSFLPHARRLNGKKVLLGDNLSSHLNMDVIRKCEENDILFVCLPPNSTHLLQPLDVAFFKPFKTAWRSILTAWKVAHPRNSTVQKEKFPTMLKTSLEKMDSVPDKGQNQDNINAIKRILVSGFGATGIFPLDPQRVLRKIPDGINPGDAEEIVNDSLTNLLQSQREAGRPNFQGRPKRKKLNIAPGKSVATESSSEESDIEISESETSETEEVLQESDEEQLPVNNDEELHVDSEEELYARPSTSSTANKDEEIREGKYALIKFSAEKSSASYIYVCCINKIISDNELEVYGYRSFIKKDLQKFRLVENDISLVSKADIICILPEPKKGGTSHRPEFTFPKRLGVKEY